MGKQHGFTLIELLVTIVILGVVMTPMVQSYVFAWKTSIDSARKSKAVMLANWKIEMLKNKDGYDGVSGEDWSSCTLPDRYTDGDGVEYQCKVTVDASIEEDAIDPNFKAKQVSLKISYPSIIQNQRRTINCMELDCDEEDYTTFFTKLKE